MTSLVDSSNRTSRPRSLYVTAPLCKKCNPNKVFPQPGPPHTKVGLPLGRPPCNPFPRRLSPPQPRPPNPLPTGARRLDTDRDPPEIVCKASSAHATSIPLSGQTFPSAPPAQLRSSTSKSPFPPYSTPPISGQLRLSPPNSTKQIAACDSAAGRVDEFANTSMP